MSALVLNDVRIIREDFEVSISLTAEAGTITALTGPNGCGKSTILETIAGLIRPISGEIRLGDAIFDNASHHEEPVDRWVGYVPQSIALFGHLTVLENVAYGPRARRVPKAQAHEEARIWLDAMDMTEFADTQAARLSGGQSQKVAIARALASRPKLLLFDEPFTALDHDSKLSLPQLVSEAIAQLHVPAIIVSHENTELTDLATRVIQVST